MISYAIQTVKDVVEGLGQSYKYYSLKDGGNTARVYTYNFGWLEAEDNVVIDGAMLTVSNVVCGKYFDVIKTEETILPSHGTFAIGTVKFKHGTVTRVNNELVNIAGGDIAATLPLVYMVEVMTESQDLRPEANITQSPEVRLFILEQVDFQTVQTGPEYYAAVLNKTDLIAEELLEAFKRNKSKIGVMSSSRTWNHLNAGVYSDKKAERNMFDYYLSGTELRLTLPLVKQNCKC